MTTVANASAVADVSRFKSCKSSKARSTCIMPTPSIHINPGGVNWKQLAENLSPTPGICIFVDIAGSTAMKQQGIRHWIALIHNCFANVGMFLDPFSPIKGIGDALMYYIEAQDLEQSGYRSLQIFDGLWQVATDTDARFPVVKIGAAWCEQAYAITFLRGSQDYYGIDVDMTARLQALAHERQVVIEQRLYDKVNADYQFTGNKNDFDSFRSLVGPHREALKGIPDGIEVFRTLEA